jgi:hypothetical protein
MSPSKAQRLLAIYRTIVSRYALGPRALDLTD